MRQAEESHAAQDESRGEEYRLRLRGQPGDYQVLHVLRESAVKGMRDAQIFDRQR